MTTDDKSVSDDRLREIISLHQGNNVLWPPHVVTGEVLSMASELLSRRSPPSGYRLVPVEPTEAMCGAGMDPRIDGIAPMYRAMLAAAPKSTEGK